MNLRFLRASTKNQSIDVRAHGIEERKKGGKWLHTHAKLLGMLQIMRDVLSEFGSKAGLVPPAPRDGGGGAGGEAGVALLQGVRTERGEKLSSTSARGDSSISAMLQRLAGSGGGGAHGKSGNAGGTPAA